MNYLAQTVTERKLCCLCQSESIEKLERVFNKNSRVAFQLQPSVFDRKRLNQILRAR